MTTTWWKCEGCAAILPERADKCSECGKERPRPAPAPDSEDGYYFSFRFGGA